MSSLIYSAQLEALLTTTEIEHDPAGPPLQVHGLPDGGGVITFDEYFLAELGWQVGDTLVFSGCKDGCRLTCPEATMRSVEYQRMLDDGAPV